MLCIERPARTITDHQGLKQQVHLILELPDDTVENPILGELLDDFDLEHTANVVAFFHCWEDAVEYASAISGTQFKGPEDSDLSEDDLDGIDEVDPYLEDGIGEPLDEDAVDEFFKAHRRYVE